MSKHVGRRDTASFGFRHRIRSHIGRHIDLHFCSRCAILPIAFLRQLRLAVALACIRLFTSRTRCLGTRRFHYEAVVDVTQRRKQAKRSFIPLFARHRATPPRVKTALSSSRMRASVIFTLLSVAP